MKNKILVTGAAGFIGYHLCEKLIDEGYFVVGIDNLNDYYDVGLKINRLKLLEKHQNFDFFKIDIDDRAKTRKLFENFRFDIVFNFAAQAGVRNSFLDPNSYLKSNIIGFENILNLSHKYKVKYFFYASSSSVYGDSDLEKSSEDRKNSTPKSLYAVTKIFNENLAYSFSKNYNFKSIGFRFFTVYGPYGRPDMAIHIFTESIINNKQINLNNFGLSYRDYTYIDDVINSIVLIKNNAIKLKNHEIFNIGEGNPIQTKELLDLIQIKLNKKAKIKLLGPQLGDVNNTFCDNNKISNLKKINYLSKEAGISKFIDWYVKYYK